MKKNFICSFLVPPILPSWKVEGGGGKGCQYRHTVPCFITESTVVVGRCLDSLWFISFHFCWNGSLPWGNSVLFSMLKIPVGRSGCVSLYFASSPAHSQVPTSSLVFSYCHGTSCEAPEPSRSSFFQRPWRAEGSSTYISFLNPFLSVFHRAYLLPLEISRCSGDLPLFTCMSKCLRTQSSFLKKSPNSLLSSPLVAAEWVWSLIAQQASSKERRCLYLFLAGNLSL